MKTKISDLSSIGHLACRYRCDLAQVERAASMLGITPVLRLNGVPYYSTEQERHIAKRLRSQQEARHDR